MTNTVGEIPIERIAVSREFQSRETLDEATIEEYVRVAKEAEHDDMDWPFPPVEMVGGFLIDGHHRLEAAKRLGYTTLLAYEEPGDEKDAILAAIKANSEHGLRRNQADIRRAIGMALKVFPEESDRAIARLVETSHPTVGKVRSKINSRSLDQVVNLSTRQSSNSGETKESQHSSSLAVAPPAGGEQKKDVSQAPSLELPELQKVKLDPMGPPAKSATASEHDLKAFAKKLIDKHYGPGIRGLDDLAEMLGGRGEVFAKGEQAFYDAYDAIERMGQGFK